MIPGQLTLTGQARIAYRIGHPLWLWDGVHHVGTVQHVALQADGTRIALDEFVYAQTPSAHRTVVRKLALLEVTAFLIDVAPGMVEITFVLNHRTAGVSDGVRLASARSRLLDSMGAEQIKVIPHIGSGGDGHFGVEAVWRYNAANLAALKATLTAAREENAREHGAKVGWMSRLRGFRKGA